MITCRSLALRASADNILTYTRRRRTLLWHQSRRRRPKMLPPMPRPGLDISRRFVKPQMRTPCTIPKILYNPAEYLSKLKIVNYVGICSVALCCFFLLSFLVLPPERSSRHYLAIGVTLAITFFSIPFVIPLGTEPSMCHDKITPNGQGSDLSCAWTGALLLLGAMGSALWSTSFPCFCLSLTASQNIPSANEDPAQSSSAPSGCTSACAGR